MTLLLQDEKGAFNFDQETVINPETGEQVRVAWVGCQGMGRGAQVGWQPPLKPASWVPLPDPELVPERGDLGQHVQHHRLQLRRVPSGERGPLSLPPPPSARVRAAEPGPGLGGAPLWMGGKCWQGGQGPGSPRPHSPTTSLPPPGSLALRGLMRKM